MDIDAGVATPQARHLDPPGRSCARRNKPDLASSSRVDAPGATDTQRPDLFGVKVEEILGLQHAGREFRSARESGLLVNRESELQRTMGNVSAFHHGQCGGHADSVIGAQGRAIRLQPVAISYDLDRIGIEVMRSSLVLLADHVEVAL